MCEREWQIGSSRASEEKDETRRLFAAIVLPYLNDAYSLARWLTGNAVDAEDVVQESCMRALRGIGLYSGGNPRAWLLTIVRNTAFTWLRSNRPAGQVQVEDWANLEQDVEPAPNAEATLIAAADAKAFQSALAALPELFREAIVLREINDLSYRDIAAVTGVAIGTVMSRLARGRALLIKSLAGVKE